MAESPIVPWTPFIPHKPHPKQLAALMVPSRELLFGGAAGGGKSDWLLMSALQYVDVPYYSAIIFRKTLSDLKQEEALITRAAEWLGEWHPYVKYSAEDHAYIFPNRSKLAFGYIGEFRTNERYQGAAYQFCLEENEFIKTFSGKKRIRDLVIGDVVSTLEGSKRITYIAPSRISSCVSLSGPYGSQLQSIDHRILSQSGWVSYSDLFSKYATQFDEFRNIDEYAMELSSESQMLAELLREDRRPSYEPDSRSYLGTPLRDFGVSLIDDRNDSSKSDELCQVASQLPKLIVHAAIASPAFQSERFSQSNSDRSYEDHGVLSALSTQDCQDHCHAYFDFYDERSLGLLGIYQEHLPSQACAEESFQRRSTPDVRGDTPRHNLAYLRQYIHPYTMKEHSSSVAFEFLPCELSYVGERTVIDIRVESVSHYISSSNFVNSNCGFDELTQHFEEDYLYLFSRVRRTQCEHHAGRVENGEPSPLPDDPKCRLCRRYSPLRNVPLRIRATCNPGGPGHQWVKERFKIERNEAGQWIGHHPDRPFIPSKIEDNPSLDLKEYHEMLMNLDPLTREQLRYGYWGAPENARFKARWFGWYAKKGDMLIIEPPNHRPKYTLHSDYLQVFVTIDPAASVREGIAGVRFHQRVAPSHGVISVWGVTPTGDLLWLDMDRMQSESPEFLQRVRTIVRIWHPSFVVCEAIGVGLPIYQMLASMGMPIEPLRSVPDKVANSIEAQVRAEQGKVFLPREAAWMKQVEDEVFTWTGHPHQTADIVDTFSNASHQVTRLAGEDQFDPLCGAGAVCEAHVPSFEHPINGGLF